MDNKINVKVEKLPKSSIDLTITAGVEELKDALDRSYKVLADGVEVKGFRKGKAPKNMIIEQLGPNLYDEAVNLLIYELTNKALAQENLSPITKPIFSITSFDPQKELVYKVKFAVYPEIKIGDLKKVKIDPKDLKLAKEEREHHEKGTKEDHKHIDHFNLEKYYSEILDKVFSISNIEVPDEMIEQELRNHEANFVNRLKDLGINIDDYLKLQNTTLEESKEKWKKDIEFSYRQDFLLYEYAKDNKIKAEEDEIKKSLEAVYSPSEIEKLDKNMYNYAASVITIQKAFTHLINFIENNNDKSSTGSNSNRKRT